MFPLADEPPLPVNIYEEVLNDETTLDLSSRDLDTLPEIKNKNICVLYLQNNKLTTLPEDLFSSLPSLMYLDLRDNCLTDLPKGIKHHPCLTHLLLQNNCLTSLPDELGSCANLKVLQLNGNELTYPPREVINEGTTKVVKYLYDKFVETLFTLPDVQGASPRSSNAASQEGVSYNSVLDPTLKGKTRLSVQFTEKDSEEDVSYDKIKGKCPKLDKSRHKVLPAYSQSAKYLKPLRADGRKTKDEKIKESFLKEVALKKHKDLLMRREKILQDRKNMEHLQSWRRGYRYRQGFVDGSYRMQAGAFPYDTSPEYMTLLSREDIEKDLPNKYRRRLTRRSKPAVPRKGADMHLALRIQQLFRSLESVTPGTRGDLTPRAEQQALLTEIQKISEIKQKLSELSLANFSSVN